MEKKGNNKKIVVAAVVLVVLLAAAAIVYFAFGAKTTEGSKAISVVIVDDAGVETSYEVKTDAQYLQEALEEIEDLEIEGEEGQYGMYIKTINGVVADYDTNGAYWSLYVNGEYGNYGVGEQPVNDGEEYTLKYETGM